MSKYIDFSNTLVPGKIMVTDSEAVEQSVVRVLDSVRGDLLDVLDYGNGLESYLYEPLSEDTEQFIRMTVRKTLSRWEDRVKLTFIDIEGNSKKLGFTVKLGLFMRDFNKHVELTSEVTK